jgi:glycosyltransferase involved in cell wall biosynthesis
VTAPRPPHVALVLGSSTGGIGRHVASVAAALTRSGVRVTVLGPLATEEQFAFTTAGARHVAVEVAAGARPLPAARALARLRRALAAGPDGVPVDVVHAHGLRAGLLAGLAVPRGLPLVVTWHNALLPGAGRAQGLLERAVARRADVTLAASSDLVGRAWRLGARDVRPHAVAAPARPPAARAREDVRAELEAAPGQPLLVTVARLHPQKGLDVLLAATRTWSDRWPPPVLAVAGSGPLEAELRRLAEGSGAAVRLLGARDDVPDLLAAADVVVLPSRWEARALVAQEALRAGRPLVASAVGGIPELVGDGARLVPPGDAAALAAAVAELLDDPTAAGALAERGRARAATWPDEDDTARHLLALYRELTGLAVPRADGTRTDGIGADGNGADGPGADRNGADEEPAGRTGRS